MFDSIEELAAACRQCNQCGLRGGCKQVVVSRGNYESGVMLVGEGPGAQEDQQGEPFVGKAGQLLDRILEAAGFKRDEVYITNVVKCRPPGNRLPTAQEAAACYPFLAEQIRLISPRIIVCLGALATQTLIDPAARITKVRGRWSERFGARVMPTFHPAALLRDSSKKRPVWEDFQKIRDAYREMVQTIAIEPAGTDPRDTGRIEQLSLDFRVSKDGA